MAAAVREAKGRKVALVIAAVLVAAVGFVALLAYTVAKSGITSGPDRMFGDQHLKTAVALIELHRVRNGSYPSDLDELKYTGGWDAGALHSVRYCPSADRRTYYVEVTRGWVGKPKLEMPAEFWRGTGYRPQLAAKCR